MTIHHVVALFIAALLFLVCEFSGKCSDKMIDHASQIAMAIVVGAFGHAGAAVRAKKSDSHGDQDGK